MENRSRKKQHCKVYLLLLIFICFLVEVLPNVATSSTVRHRDIEKTVNIAIFFRFVERHALQQQTQHATAPISSKHPSHPRHHVRTAPPQQNRGDSKKSRHSFALYASGQLNTDISDRKTHNVGPAMSTNQVCLL